MKRNKAKANLTALWSYFPEVVEFKLDRNMASESIISKLWEDN